MKKKTPKKKQKTKNDRKGDTQHVYIRDINNGSLLQLCNRMK
jgi:hypothetical protein